MLSGEKATRALQSLVQLNVVGKKNLMVEVKVLDDDCDRQKMDIRAILQEKDRLDRDVEVCIPYPSIYTSFHYIILSYSIITPPTKHLYTLSHFSLPFFLHYATGIQSAILHFVRRTKITGATDQRVAKENHRRSSKIKTQTKLVSGCLFDCTHIYSYRNFTK